MRQSTPDHPGSLPFDLPALFEEHGSGLAGAVRAILGGGVDPKELLQEAFLRAWRALQRGDRPTDPAAWLFVLTMNLARDQRRTRERRGRDQELGSEDTVLVDETKGPAQTALASEALVATRVAIEKLRPEEKDVFLLRASGEQSFDAISRTLGVPIGTAKTRMRRALKALRQDLASFAPTPRLEPEGEPS